MKSALSKIVEWIVCIVIAFVLTFLLKTYLFDIIRVSGDSMYSTLHNRDMLGVEKVSLFKKDFKHGDIIIFDPGSKGQGIYIKRIIGLPGDTVEIKDGGVYVNDKHLNETYLDPNTYTDNDLKISIKEGYVFVLGDNREVSEDSRNIGPVPIENIKGHAIFRFFPFNNIGRIK
ncbi:signal peptidase I [Clostridium cylindrosporum]|uniref:Signal peptidase I n=1 Tax=Clostridium cylindrosporum DSM 605 TaxID=1121307 RepID=A0A0J8DDZ3_CLOCY|nr:signal peptidase I [Clostridium cylindrosporum]KMT22438.1 signal peptidase I [Clostridium cylindrosporum DSM 605]